jgi:hypothetical protein
MNKEMRAPLAEGEYKGYQYWVRGNQIAYRCGYITLPKNHPWLFVGDYDEIPVHVHGGITYANGNDIGFDCAHAGDAPDPDLYTCEPGAMQSLSRLGGTIRTTEYVVNECKSMIDQAIAANRRFARLRQRIRRTWHAWRTN